MPDLRGIFPRFAASLLCLAAVLVTGCENSQGPIEPSTGSIRVVISTAGSNVDFDPDGYTLHIDDSRAVAVEVNATVSDVTVPDIAPGSHVVRLDGLATNCTVAGSNVQTVDVAVSTVSSPISFSVFCAVRTGNIKVSTVTSGLDPDVDGYEVFVAGASRGTVPPNGTSIIPALRAGLSAVMLAGLSGNCEVEGLNSRAVEIPFAGTGEVAFAIRCVTAATVRLSTTTTGVAVDPDGYRLDFHGRVAHGVTAPTNGTLALGLLAGDYQLTVLEVMPNCDVVGPNPRTVTIPSTGEIGLSIDVACTAPTQIAFMKDAGHEAEIYVVNSDGTGTTRLTNQPGVDSEPAWSPDGSRLAFASDRHGNNNREIYVMNADGTNPIRLTTSAAWDYSPTWSPDGSRIAFVSERDGNREIYVMNADGTNQVRITNRAGVDIDPSWSPDGTRIAFQADYNGGIWVMNADGSNPSRLVSNGRRPGWSPDGKMIAFVDGMSVFVVNADGSNFRQVVQYHNYPLNTSWSPDGRKIVFGAISAYDSEVASTLEMVIVSLTGVLYSSPTNLLVSSPAWRPR